MLDLSVIKIEKPQDSNIIIGQAHFIKSVEDIYEVLISSSTVIKFGLAFCESSGKCLVRSEGNDTELKEIAQDNALNIGAGHCFVVILKEAFSINVLNALKNLQEVCSIFCATANPVELVIAQSNQGRGILGVIDGATPKGKEEPEDIAWRKDFLRKIGYKR
ncbi:MAG: adenosine-specific kinase [Candidatus Omnitrophota bacterium]